MIRFEEGDYAVAQMLEIPDTVSVQVLSVIVMPPVDEDISTSKQLPNQVQYMHTGSSLNHYKIGLRLPP